MFITDHINACINIDGSELGLFFFLVFRDVDEYSLLGF